MAIDLERVARAVCKEAGVCGCRLSGKCTDLDMFVGGARAAALDVIEQAIGEAQHTGTRDIVEWLRKQHFALESQP